MNPWEDNVQRERIREAAPPVWDPWLMNAALGMFLWAALAAVLLTVSATS